MARTRSASTPLQWIAEPSFVAWFILLVMVRVTAEPRWSSRTPVRATISPRFSAASLPPARMAILWPARSTRRLQDGNSLHRGGTSPRSQHAIDSQLDQNIERFFGLRNLIEGLVEGAAHRPSQLDEAARFAHDEWSHRAEGRRTPRPRPPDRAPSRCRIASRPARLRWAESHPPGGGSAHGPEWITVGRPRESSPRWASSRRPAGCRTARRGRPPPCRLPGPIAGRPRRSRL